MTRWGPFQWTTGEAIWAAIALVVLVVEILGLYRAPIPWADGATFVPLSHPVEANIQRRAWFSMALMCGFVVLMVHWWTDLW